MKDVLGEAIADHFNGKTEGRLWVNNKYGPKEEMPILTYFRSPDDMPELEWIALQQCRGSVLDIGAGAGSHALALQQMGLDITALDISPKAADVMKKRGVRNILLQDFFRLGREQTLAQTPSADATFAPSSPASPPTPTAAVATVMPSSPAPPSSAIAPLPAAQPDPAPTASLRYDTLLLLMNGIGLAGTTDGLRHFLDHARTLLNPGGRMIFDSSDIAYLYKGKPPKMKNYYGEIDYQYEYRKKKGDWFKWLFIDRKTLSKIATAAGWQIELIFEDEWGQFLVTCTPVQP